MLSGWWMGLEPAMKILWVVTLSASLIFLIQTILTFIGVGGDTDLDLDAETPDGSGMGLLTFRNFVIYFWFRVTIIIIIITFNSLF